MCTFWDKVTGSADKQNTKVDQHISIAGVVFRSMYNACVPSFLFVQFKFLVYGLTNTDRHTHASCIAVSLVWGSLRLALLIQAVPQYIYRSTRVSIVKTEFLQQLLVVWEPPH